MSKFVAIVVTAAVCLPLGALLRGEASAERRGTAVFGIEGHPHLARAQAALHEGLDELEASKRANEALWTDQTGRATATREAVEKSALIVDQTAAWVSNGMALNGQGTQSPVRRRVLFSRFER